MPRKRHKPEEIIAKLRQVDVLASQGQTVADAVRSIGVTEVTYYRWRQEYGGLRTEQVKRLKELEAENARLRRAVADLTLDKLILKEAASPRETTEPRAAPRLRRAYPTRASGFRAPGLRGPRPAPLDAAQAPAGPGRRCGAALRTGSPPTSSSSPAGSTGVVATARWRSCCGRPRAGSSTTSGSNGSGAGRG